MKPDRSAARPISAPSVVRSAGSQRPSGSRDGGSCNALSSLGVPEGYGVHLVESDDARPCLPRTMPKAPIEPGASIADLPQVAFLGQAVALAHHPSDARGQPGHYGGHGHRRAIDPAGVRYFVAGPLPGRWIGFGVMVVLTMGIVLIWGPQPPSRFPADRYRPGLDNGPFSGYN